MEQRYILEQIQLNSPNWKLFLHSPCHHSGMHVQYDDNRVDGRQLLGMGVARKIKLLVDKYHDEEERPLLMM